MWERLNKLIKPNGAIVLFGSEPFSSALRMSNIKNYKYDWVWEKNVNSNFMLCKQQPLRHHENILLFYEKHGTYNPQMVEGEEYYRKRASNEILDTDNFNSKLKRTDSFSSERYPKSIIKITRDERQVHPTQKPVKLMEYLIKTYTNEGETVLDFTMGSGTTGVASVNTGRNFIGIELDQGYFQICEKRIAEAKKSIQLSLF